MGAGPRTMHFLEQRLLPQQALLHLGEPSAAELSEAPRTAASYVQDDYRRIAPQMAPLQSGDGVSIRVERTREAAEDLRWMTRHGRQAQAALIERSLDRFLQDEPAVERGARERMRTNTLGVTWALHVGAVRVYYDIDEEYGIVWVIRVGEKSGNTLYLRGQPFDLG